MVWWKSVGWVIGRKKIAVRGMLIRGFTHVDVLYLSVWDVPSRHVHVLQRWSS